MMDGTVLLADDDRTIRTVLAQAFTRAGCKVHATGSLYTLLRWVGEGKGDVVISDVIMPDGNGIETLPAIRQMRPDLPVIVISAQNSIMTAIQANEAQAFDYMPKPFDLPDLMKRAGQAMRHRPADDAPCAAPENLPLVGQSAVMQALYRLIARLRNSDMHCLILGESGAGKSHLAAALHDLSDRRGQGVEVMSCDDLPDHVAIEALLQRIKGGSLIVDGVETLPMAAQRQLVFVLDRAAAAGVRVMALASGDPAQQVAQGSFRSDLLYRLNGAQFDLPPLRARKDDIPALIAHFIQKMGGECRLSPKAQALMAAYDWPGNVRQLENSLKRLLLVATDRDINEDDVKNFLGHAEQPPVMEGCLADDVARHIQRYFDLHEGHLPPTGLYARILREVEGPLIDITLRSVRGNQVKCAELLGLNRNTLRKKIAELDLCVTRQRKMM